MRRPLSRPPASWTCPSTGPTKQYFKTPILAVFARDRTTAIRGMRVVPPYVHMMMLAHARGAWRRVCRALDGFGKGIAGATGWRWGPGDRALHFPRCRAAPSSGPSGHLLPAGEKGQRRHAPLPVKALFVTRDCAACSVFSPAGRRWPEGPDEGATGHRRHRH